MGIDLDLTAVGRPSTSVGGPGDPPGGEKLLPGRTHNWGARFLKIYFTITS